MSGAEFSVSRSPLPGDLGTPDIKRGAPTVVVSTLAPDHPSDEDLSPGIPVSREGWARKICFRLVTTAGAPELA